MYLCLKFDIILHEWSMALNQINKLVWIVETIRKTGKISFEELNRKWMDNTDLSNGEEMLKRTFHKWRYNILDTFGLLIECEKGGLYRYYISNLEDLRKGSIEKWLLTTYTISNSLERSRSIKERILLEEVPSGVKSLEPIIDAMKQDRLIHISYYNYWRGDIREHYLMPLCVKLFRQRWYMVGKVWTNDFVGIYSLDRIRDFRLSSHTFEYPKDFDPQAYFEGHFGIIVGADISIEQVVLKVSASQANYLRDLPLHTTQQEKERYEDYSLFELNIRPTYDFQQEILWNGEGIEVLQPSWLRQEIAERLRGMCDTYKED